jgi:UDP:flavonoid glycosyltransferase YjiC (YdhE family)
VRVLGCTTAGTGHFFPMVPLLRSCVEAGHDVVVACPDSFTSTVISTGFAVAPFEEAPPEAWGAVMRLLPGRAPDEANRIVLREVFGRLGTAAALPGLSASFEQWHPDLVLRDPAEFASWVLAQQSGVPIARVGISLLSLEPRWAEAAAEGIGSALGQDVADVAALAGGDVFTAAPASFDPPAAAVTVHRYRDPPAPETDITSLPEGDAPLVYVTLGTVAASLGAWPDTYRAILDGLEGLGVRGLVTTGSEVDPSDLGPLPAEVAVTRFEPQDAVLALAAVMVAHGGFGTVLGGLRAGVPMALAPLFADQFDNAARVAEVGAGVVLPTTFDPRVTAKELPDAVQSAVTLLLDAAETNAVSTNLAREVATHPPASHLVGTLEEIAARRPQ